MEIIRVTTLGDEILNRISPDDIEHFVGNVVKSDPILSKFFQFAFNPPIDEDFEAYPKEQKIQECRNIIESDWNYFNDKFFKATGNNKECFRFFKFRLKSMYSCIKHLYYFPSSSAPLDLIYTHTSFNSLTESVDSNGKKTIWISMGQYWPVIWLDFIAHQDKGILECRYCWLIRKPDDEELSGNDWDKYSFKLYQDHYDDFYEMLAGYDLKSAKKTLTKFRLYYFFQGKKLKLSKRGYFEFPIFHRYEPKIRRTANVLRNIEKLREAPIDQLNEAASEGYIWETTKMVFGLAKEYEDNPHNPNPSGYLMAKLRESYGDQIKSLYTTNQKFLKNGKKQILRSFVERESDTGELDNIPEQKGDSDQNRVRTSEVTEDRSFDGIKTYFGDHFINEKTYKLLIDKLKLHLKPNELELLNIRMDSDENEKLTQDEIGEIINKDRSTVSKMEKRIRLKLEKLLEKESLSKEDLFINFD